MDAHTVLTVNWSFYVTAAVLGAVLGSFINVVIHRGPVLWKLVDDDARGDLAVPRSYCPSCKAQIQAIYLIPLASYLMLGGKCQNCRAPIPLRYPLVELGGMVAALASLAIFGLTAQAACAFVFFLFLLALAAIDSETGYLPDALTLPLIILGVVANAFGLFNATPGAAVLGAVIGFGAFWLIDKAFEHVRGMSGLGLGDAKLLAAIGAWFGWPVLPTVVFLAAIMALIGVGAASLSGAKIERETPIPFGPALAAAGAFAMIGYGLRLPLFY